MSFIFEDAVNMPQEQPDRDEADFKPSPSAMPGTPVRVPAPPEEPVPEPEVPRLQLDPEAEELASGEEEGGTGEMSPSTGIQQVSWLHSCGFGIIFVGTDPLNHFKIIK